MIDYKQFEGHTPGPWYVLEVRGNSFVAAKPTEDHPYFGKTRNMDVGGAEDYPRRTADLALIAAAPELLAELKRLQHTPEELVRLKELCVADGLREAWDAALAAGAVRADAELKAENKKLREGLEKLTDLIRDCHNVFQNHSASWIMQQASFKNAEAALNTDAVGEK